jgi:AcrR family transcriptional regulator
MSVTSEQQRSSSPTPRDKTLRRLVEAVNGLLTEGEDYTRLSVERIISRADIARSTFYAHYDGKGALLRAVGEVTQVLEASRAWSALPDDADRDGLREAFAHFFGTYRQHGALMGAMAEVSAYDEDVRREFSRLITVGGAELTAHVEQGQRAGSVRADVDPVTTIRWLIWMVERGLYQLVRTARPQDLDQHVDTVTSIVWASLYEGAPTRRQ